MTWLYTDIRESNNLYSLFRYLSPGQCVVRGFFYIFDLHSFPTRRSSDLEKIQELVSRSQQDDKRAFALLVSEFQPLVFRLAFRLLCDEEEARDITQETFVKVWLSLKTYNQENRLSTWLYKITCNTCYDRLRSLRHSPLDNESAFSDSVNIPSDDHIEISLSNKQLKELILRYTNELPPQQKLVFTLRDVEELEVAEVQIITGLSPEKIKSTLYLARKNIRNKMNQIDPDL